MRTEWVWSRCASAPAWSTAFWIWRTSVRAARWSGSPCPLLIRRRMTEPRISVLLVDDHSLVRRGFRRMLEDDPAITVIGEAEDGPQTVQLAAELLPKVVVMDFAMP